jgi:hypothetical protein
MPVGLFINYGMNICLYIGVEQNASLRTEISWHVLIFSYRVSLRPLGYILFVLSPLKKLEKNLKITLKILGLFDGRISKRALHIT